MMLLNVLTTRVEFGSRHPASRQDAAPGIETARPVAPGCPSICTIYISLIEGNSDHSTRNTHEFITICDLPQSLRHLARRHPQRPIKPYSLPIEHGVANNGFGQHGVFRGVAETTGIRCLLTEFQQCRLGHPF